jgi:hypothetical protein
MGGPPPSTEPTAADPHEVARKLIAGFRRADIVEELIARGMSSSAASGVVSKARNIIARTEPPSDRLLIARLEYVYQRALADGKPEVASRALSKLCDVTGAQRRGGKAKPAPSTSLTVAELGERLLRQLAAGEADPATVQAFGRVAAAVSAMAPPDESEDEVTEVATTVSELAELTIAKLRRVK